MAKKSTASRLSEAPTEPTTATVSVPLGVVSAAAFVPRRCDVQQLTEVQRITLKRITNGLADAGGRLASGKPVQRDQDAVKWLLEEIASRDSP